MAKSFVSNIPLRWLQNLKVPHCQDQALSEDLPEQ